MIHRAVMLASLLACGACSRHDEPPPLPTETRGSPSATSPTLAVEQPTGSAADRPPLGHLPTEEDFEEESASKITPETLDAQLDALEREIQAE